jgi:hypothetical protein
LCPRFGGCPAASHKDHRLQGSRCPKEETGLRVRARRGALETLIRQIVEDADIEGSIIESESLGGRYPPAAAAFSQRSRKRRSVATALAPTCSV